MIFGLSFLSLSPFTSEDLSTKCNYNFDSLDLYSGIFDTVWLRGNFIELSDKKCTDLLNSPAWTSDTYFLGTYDGYLNGGNAIGLDEDVQSFVLYRKDSNNIISKIGEYSNINQCIDYTVSNGEYQYFGYYISPNKQSYAVLSDKISIDYNDWFIVDYEKDNVYRLQCNLVSGEQVLNENTVEIQTNDKYPIISKGKTQHYSSSITALILEDEDGNQSNTIIDNLKELCTSARKVILKDRRGRNFLVKLSNFRQNLLSDNINKQPLVLSFDWKECGDIDECIHKVT